MTELFKNRYRIPSARLQTWDYGWNAPYFVTICTKARENFFGNIENGEMILSEIGVLAKKFWDEIPLHFPFVELDEYQILPNHVHGIVIINKKNDGLNDLANNGTGSVSIVGSDFIVGSETVETRQCLVSTTNTTNTTPETEPAPKPIPKFNNKKTSPPSGSQIISENLIPGQKRIHNQGKNTLSSIIGSYKSVVSKYAHEITPEFAWQSRFHDHIIRNNAEFDRIKYYISENPENWKDDKFFK